MHNVRGVSSFPRTNRIAAGVGDAKLYVIIAKTSLNKSLAHSYLYLLLYCITFCGKVDPEIAGHDVSRKRDIAKLHIREREREHQSWPPQFPDLRARRCQGLRQPMSQNLSNQMLHEQQLHGFHRQSQSLSRRATDLGRLQHQPMYARLSKPQSRHILHRRKTQ